MGPALSVTHDGKKFMWNGCSYSTREEAVSAGTAYQNDNFEIRLAEEEGKFLVYTRRVVKELSALQ